MSNRLSYIAGKVRRVSLRDGTTFIECPLCFALVTADRPDGHRDWHRAESERIERMLDRSEAR